jgi:LPXTG-motif cell wall-anchored protein
MKFPPSRGSRTVGSLAVALVLLVSSMVPALAQVQTNPGQCPAGYDGIAYDSSLTWESDGDYAAVILVGGPPAGSNQNNQDPDGRDKYFYDVEAGDILAREAHEISHICVLPHGDDEPPPSTIETTPAEPMFADPDCDGTEAGFTAEDTDEYTYSITGTVGPGETVTITATPRDGYTFPQDAETSWEHTFDSLDDCDTDDGGEDPFDTTPAEPMFADPDCDGTEAGFTAEDTDEYTYSITGTVGPGETVTVTATPRDGYTFPQDAETSWEHTFTALDDLDCEADVEDEIDERCPYNEALSIGHPACEVEVGGEQLERCPWDDHLMVGDEDCVEPSREQRTPRTDPDGTADVVETAVLGVTLQQAADDDAEVADELADTGASSLLTLVLAGLLSLGLGGVMLRRRDETA